MTADDDTVAVAKDYPTSPPKGRVIKVTDPDGNSFELIAEGRAFRDFILHRGSPSYGLQGQRSRYGGLRVLCSADRLARAVAEGLCTIELAAPNTKESPQ
ncbi:hypothetical protein B1729_14520 [Microbacterium sp. B35-04]|uniref:hypothetical protein n=1 Tax=Microbacterium sp. B35-04 TaxID=1961716 RepID=UPI0013D012D3|nr:hypothetical protein [Microbacterium sp. B35-04]KAF2412523.1 hypothetical protein B1729_14520 [Microbacterium sp. B35-04]